MKFFGTTLVSALVFVVTAVAAAPSAHMSPCPPEGDFQMLPAGMDVDSANRVWCWMKHQVHAPQGLPPPPVLVGPLQLNKYSVFMFPTPEAPGNVFSIEIALDTVQYEDPSSYFGPWVMNWAHALFT